MSRSRMQAVAIVSILLMLLPGCYWKHYSVDGRQMPTRLDSDRLSHVAGVVIDSQSSAPKAAQTSPTSVVDLFVRRLAEDKLFDDIVYPYSKLAHVDPDLILDVTVKIEEKERWVENIVKAILIGASLLVLQPVLPIRFGAVVDLSVVASSRAGLELGRYSYRSEYTMLYTAMTPRKSKFDEWLEATKAHAVEEVLNQIKADRVRLQSASLSLSVLILVSDRTTGRAA